MNSSRVTIREVAQAAGVSVTTVSHALNGKGKVSAATITRVQDAAEQLGYRPSATAQALRSGRTGAIALVVPRESQGVSAEILGLDYYVQIAAAAASTAFGHNRPLVLPPELKTATDWERVNPDGVLLCDPVGCDPLIDMLEGIGIPVVTIERDGGRPDWMYYVAGDNVSNTQQVLDHLYGQGARRIALLATDWTRGWSTDIDTTYADWCDVHGQDQVRVVVPVQFDQRDARAAAGALLDGSEPPDAFYAPAEKYSSGIARACAERGLRIPEDILLVCGNDGREARDSTPSVTAVDLRAAEQIAAAVELLIARIEGREVPVPVIVPSKLHVRASTNR